MGKGEEELVGWGDAVRRGVCWAVGDEPPLHPMVTKNTAAANLADLMPVKQGRVGFVTRCFLAGRLHVDHHPVHVHHSVGF